jgi:hypothetical protein
VTNNAISAEYPRKKRLESPLLRFPEPVTQRRGKKKREKYSPLQRQVSIIDLSAFFPSLCVERNNFEMIYFLMQRVSRLELLTYLLASLRRKHAQGPKLRHYDYEAEDYQHGMVRNFLIGLSRVQGSGQRSARIANLENIKIRKRGNQADKQKIAHLLLATVRSGYAERHYKNRSG